ncbi:hypothetical protein QFC22_001792 [Naganishia vaughanmartiniae]|uniref:Uncharacterized protein n=1 Tax=Naganishia vaughanmartiniae TaxID=1424756 RepID=A0ACC2XG55_9TREE|nr:hypothetical protein QFC22_001792 [Naganishia vaughanmartiniae]
MLARARMSNSAMALSRAHRLPLARPLSYSILQRATRPAFTISAGSRYIGASRAYSVATPSAGDAAAALDPIEQVVKQTVEASREIDQVSNNSASPEATTIAPPASHDVLHASSTPPTQAEIATQILPQPPADALTPSIEQLIAANPDNVSAVLNSPEAVHAAMRIGDLKLLGLDHNMFNVAGWLRDALEIIHVNAGLPWWGTIALAAGVMRLALFPLVARMNGNNARMQVIAPQQQLIMTKIQDASKRGDQAAQMIYSQELRKLWQKNECSPFRTMLLPLVQVPLFMTFFFAIRGMTALPVPQLKEGGLLWFTDLVAADPYYILPTTSMLLTLAVIEVGADGTSKEITAANKSQAHMKNGMRAATIIAIPFIAAMPAGLTFYWTFSNSLTLLQAATLKNATIRRLLNIPVPPPQPKFKGVKVEKPPTMMDSVRALRDVMTNRWAKAKENAEQHKKSGAATAGKRPTPRLAGLEQSEIIREATPFPVSPTAEPVVASSSPAETASMAAAMPPSPTAKATPARKAAVQVKTVSPAQAEKDARVAAARLRRQRR